MAYTPGPKELQLRALKEQRVTRKPSTAELREKIAEVKALPKPAKKAAKKGKKR